MKLTFWPEVIGEKDWCGEFRLRDDDKICRHPKGPNWLKKSGTYHCEFCGAEWDKAKGVWCGSIPPALDELGVQSYEDSDGET